MTLNARLEKLEQNTKQTLYPGGCTRAEIVSEMPANPDKDTFYIHLVSVEPKLDKNDS